MTQLLHGFIYGYRDPATKRFRYIGQTLDLSERHKRHLKRSLPVDKWLRSFSNPPEPEILCKVTGVDRCGFLDDMANRETMAMFHYHTYIVSYPDEGGFNKTIPRSEDYQNIGRIGGLIRGPALGRENVKNGHLAKIRTHEHQVAAARLGGSVQGPIQGRKNVENGHIRALGRTQGRKNVENGRLAKLRTPEHQSKAGRVVGINNVKSGLLDRIRPKAMHALHHTKRGIVSPTCAYCVPTAPK